MGPRRHALHLFKFVWQVNTRSFESRKIQSSQRNIKSLRREQVTPDQTYHGTCKRPRNTYFRSPRSSRFASTYFAPSFSLRAVNQTGCAMKSSLKSSPWQRPKDLPAAFYGRPKLFVIILDIQRAIMRRSAILVHNLCRYTCNVIIYIRSCACTRQSSD